jgi:hypothetical protein
MAIVKDHRESPGTNPIGFVVFTDSFMSGWGHADGGRSLYALEVTSLDQVDVLLANGKRRSDMKRGRFVRTLRNVRLGARDHLSITDKENASRWYEERGF